MSPHPAIQWLDEPEEKDYAAAASFLSMIVAPASLSAVVEGLRGAPDGHWAAKDILRAAALPPLDAKQSDEVAEKLVKVKDGRRISPILLVAGLGPNLVIADGYHRSCAAYAVSEDAQVPAKLYWHGS